jgi:hypothetical protein
MDHRTLLILSTLTPPPRRNKNRAAVSRLGLDRHRPRRAGQNLDCRALTAAPPHRNKDWRAMLAAGSLLAFLVLMAVGVGMLWWKR